MLLRRLAVVFPLLLGYLTQRAAAQQGFELTDDELAFLDEELIDKVITLVEMTRECRVFWAPAQTKRSTCLHLSHAMSHWFALQDPFAEDAQQDKQFGLAPEFNGSAGGTLSRLKYTGIGTTAYDVAAISSSGAWGFGVGGGGGGEKGGGRDSACACMHEQYMHIGM
jgi:hypothetical protein